MDVSLGSALQLLLLLLIILFRGGIELNPGPFPCRCCSAIPETLASNIRHQHLHSVSKNFSYHCPEPSCIFSTKSFNYMNQHVSIFHRDTKHVDPVATEILRCDCKIGGVPCIFTTSSLWQLVQHLCKHLDNEVEVECPIDKCHFKKSFNKKQTFRTHLAQYHRNWGDEGVPKRRVREPSQEDISTSEASDEANQVEDQVPISPGTEENHDLFSDAAVLDCIAKFYLQLYGLHSLPYETIQDICDGLICMTEVNHAKMKMMLTQELQNINIPENKINQISHNVLSVDILFASHHKDKGKGPFLSSDFLRKKYFQENMGFCPPKEINLGEDDTSSDLRQEIIPITPTLLRLFKDPIVCRDIDESFSRKVQETSDVVSDYTEGKQFISENHPSREIHIFIYQDTVNAVMSALGSAKNKHKLLMMSFTLGNLKPHRRARVETKHIIMIMKESVFKTVQAEKALEEVMRELKNLEEEGVMYKGERVKVVVVGIQGDSLGQHLIGGFIECFSATFFCRFCDIMRDEFKDKPTLIKSPRTVTDYNRCVLEALASGKPCKGIKTDSEFNSLQYVHATTHLFPCIAHDLFEGVVSWDLSGIIACLVDDGWFTYKWLNNRIKALNCQGADSPNKPAFVNRDGLKLGGHAVQNWTLLRLLPYIVGNKIKDVEHQAWELYLKLKQLCEFFTAPSFSKTDLPFILDVLLPSYFELRASVLDIERYPLKPKHHFMMHYVWLMLQYGPLLHLWTLPYEQRHKFFKHLLRLSQNFINSEHSCAFRYQLHTTFLDSEGPLFHEDCNESGAQAMSPSEHSGALANVISISFNEPGWRDCTSVCFCGIKFKREDLLLLSEDEGSVVTGRIKIIASNKNLLTFVCELLECSYEPSLGIYFLPDPSGRYITVHFNDLKYPTPHPVYVFKDKLSFSLKHKLLPST